MNYYLAGVTHRNYGYAMDIQGWNSINSSIDESYRHILAEDHVYFEFESVLVGKLKTNSAPFSVFIALMKLACS